MRPPMPVFRVIVAEDNAPLRIGLGKILERDGLEVIGSAKNGREAVDMTIACLRAETLGAIGWRVHVFASDAESWSIPDGWSSGRYSEPAPWLDLGADEVVVYIRAGAFFDRLMSKLLIKNMYN